MANYIYLALAMTLWVFGLVSLIRFGYHFLNVVDSVRKDRKLLFYMCLPFSVWVGPFVDQNGSYHRYWMTIYGLSFLVFGALFAAAVSLHGPL